MIISQENDIFAWAANSFVRYEAVLPNDVPAGDDWPAVEDWPGLEATICVLVQGPALDRWHMPPGWPLLETAPREVDGRRWYARTYSGVPYVVAGDVQFVPTVTVVISTEQVPPRELRATYGTLRRLTAEAMVYMDAYVQRRLARLATREALLAQARSEVATMGGVE